MPVQVKIGGVEYTVSELSFITMERAWEPITIALVTEHPMQSVSAALSVVASAITEESYFDEKDFNIDEELIVKFTPREDQLWEQVQHFLKRQLKASEIKGLRESFMKIMKEAGLEAAEGEPKTEFPVNLLTETSTASSPNSSPQELREGAGIE